MAKEPDLSDEDPAVLREQIEETRSSLTEKLETLEQEVKETVSGAKTAVTETVDSVKETVEETVQTVKQTFDVRRQVENHPWAMVGGSLLAGFVLGQLIPREPRYGDRSDLRRWTSSRASPFSPQPDGSATAARATEPEQRPSEPSAPGPLSGLTDRFHDEIKTLKGLAIGMALGAVRDLVTQSLPEQIAPEIRNVINGITSKLGGAPIHGPVLETTFGKRAPDSSSQERSPAMA